MATVQSLAEQVFRPASSVPAPPHHLEPREPLPPPRRARTGPATIEERRELLDQFPPGSVPSRESLAAVGLFPYCKETDVPSPLQYSRETGESPSSSSANAGIKAKEATTSPKARQAGSERQTRKQAPRRGPGVTGLPAPIKIGRWGGEIARERGYLEGMPVMVQEGAKKRAGKGMESGSARKRQRREGPDGDLGTGSSEDASFVDAPNHPQGSDGDDFVRSKGESRMAAAQESVPLEQPCVAGGPDSSRLGEPSSHTGTRLQFSNTGAHDEQLYQFDFGGDPFSESRNSAGGGFSSPTQMLVSATTFLNSETSNGGPGDNFHESVSNRLRSISPYGASIHSGASPPSAAFGLSYTHSASVSSLRNADSHPRPTDSSKPRYGLLEPSDECVVGPSSRHASGPDLDIITAYDANTERSAERISSRADFDAETIELSPLTSLESLRSASPSGEKRPSELSEPPQELLPPTGRAHHVARHAEQARARTPSPERAPLLPMMRELRRSTRHKAAATPAPGLSFAANVSGSPAPSSTPERIPRKRPSNGGSRLTASSKPEPEKPSWRGQTAIVPLYLHETDNGHEQLVLKLFGHGWVNQMKGLEDTRDLRKLFFQPPMPAERTSSAAPDFRKGWSGALPGRNLYFNDASEECSRIKRHTLVALSFDPISLDPIIHVSPGGTVKRRKGHFLDEAVPSDWPTMTTSSLHDATLHDLRVFIRRTLAGLKKVALRRLDPRIRQAFQAPFNIGLPTQEKPEASLIAPRRNLGNALSDFERGEIRVRGTLRVRIIKLADEDPTQLKVGVAFSEDQTKVKMTYLYGYYGPGTKAGVKQSPFYAYPPIQHYPLLQGLTQVTIDVGHDGARVRELGKAFSELVDVKYVEGFLAWRDKLLKS